MYIRTREEALDALAETLRRPERRARLLYLPVKIILCLHPAPRRLLADALASLVEGTLDDMARRRSERRDAVTGEPVTLSAEADALYETLGRAWDSLRLGRVAASVFHRLAGCYEPWEFARAARAGEGAVRDCVTAALRARAAATQGVAEAREVEMSARIDRAVPVWHDRAPLLKAACETACGPGSDADEMYNILAAADDTFVLPLLDRLDGAGPMELSTARDVSLMLRRLEESGADDPSRQVA